MEQPLPPHIQTLTDEVKAAFPDASVGGDVDFPDGCFLVEISRPAANAGYWITCEDIDWPSRYGVLRFDLDEDFNLNTRCDEYFGTFEEAKARLFARMRETIQ